MQFKFFQSLGDPIRLELVQRLASGIPYTITTLSEGFNITRQGVRKHLQILVDSNIITLEKNGRDTTVRLNRESLEQGKVFIMKLENRWDEHLEALRRGYFLRFHKK
ncbi:MAG: helix-turn-helix domain-containing protein [bacterium]|nr:helix-turn-helix domain-containing protein [bacterium]